MIITMMVIVYLLIGAFIGWKDHEMVEEAIENVSEEVPMNMRKALAITVAILVIIWAPINELKIIISNLKTTK